MRRTFLHATAATGLGLLPGLGWTASPATAPAPAAGPPPPRATALPAPLRAALARLRIPPSAFGAVVLPLQDRASPLPRPRLAWNAGEGFNPASVFKLVTTCAALERLGPAFAWRTPAYLDGTLRGDGVLDGQLILRGSGDPTLVQERLWLLLRRLRQLGLREIRGDIVLDRSLFAPPERQPGDFDGEASRPYNVLPDALLLNFKSLTLGFAPGAQAGQARVLVDPPALAGVSLPASVPLGANPGGGCEEARRSLQLRNEPATQLRLEGALPAGCESSVVQTAFADPASYGPRLIEALWRELGGELRGRVREGSVPAGLAPVAESVSPPLAQVVRDINKFSNNVMAEQLLLTLAAQGAAHPVGRADGQRVLQSWLEERLGRQAPGEALEIDNGSGLSRLTRLTPWRLARLLHLMFHGPLAGELMASLPVSGLDGTLKRFGAAPGRAHLKTGTLRDATGIAGYVVDERGRHHAVVAMLSHEQALAARPVMETLIDWTIQTSVTTSRR